MGMGSYILGATVRIPFQITDGGVPVSDSVPYVDKIIKPSGAEISGFPRPMDEIDSEMGTYEYRFVPNATGDYIVIISVEIDDDTYVSLENFTVSSKVSGNGSSDCSKVPRAESR
jgi:hypothetical protein